MKLFFIFGMGPLLAVLYLAVNIAGDIRRKIREERSQRLQVAAGMAARRNSSTGKEAH